MRTQQKNFLQAYSRRYNGCEVQSSTCVRRGSANPHSIVIVLQPTHYIPSTHQGWSMQQLMCMHAGTLDIIDGTNFGHSYCLKAVQVTAGTHVCKFALMYHFKVIYQSVIV